MSDDLNKVAADLARVHAENCETAGDFVGADDTALSNYLYGAAVALRLYARKREEQGDFYGIQ